MVDGIQAKEDPHLWAMPDTNLGKNIWKTLWLYGCAAEHRNWRSVKMQGWLTQKIQWSCQEWETKAGAKALAGLPQNASSGMAIRWPRKITYKKKFSSKQQNISIPSLGQTECISMQDTLHSIVHAQNIHSDTQLLITLEQIQIWAFWLLSVIDSDFYQIGLDETMACSRENGNMIRSDWTECSHSTCKLIGLMVLRFCKEDLLSFRFSVGLWVASSKLKALVNQPNVLHLTSDWRDERWGNLRHWLQEASWPVKAQPLVANLQNLLLYMQTSLQWTHLNIQGSVSTPSDHKLCVAMQLVKKCMNEKVCPTRSSWMCANHTNSSPDLLTLLTKFLWQGKSACPK